ncbi:MAG: SGNH/GDSL hydrolase family protein [Cyanobacteria bacterium P01_A01_bin.45]
MNNNPEDNISLNDESISQIYAFGDSYSDDGLSLEISTNAVNAGVTDSFILPADPELGLYDPQGRWTNGPTAVEVLSENLGVYLTDYAVGGAKSGDGNYYSWLDSFENTGLFGQIDQFSTELSGKAADSDALYFIFISANDFFEYADFGLPGTIEELATQTVENILEGISELSTLGAEQFFVVNSSDLGILPGTIEFGQAEEAALFTQEVNDLLPQELQAQEQELDVEIALYDHVDISNEIRSNPQNYGLTNIDDPYQPVFPIESPADSSPDEYYFWDEYHPTSRVHQIIGEDMAGFVDFVDEDGNDQIFGTADADNIDGGEGDDTIYGNGGEDTILGGNGNNIIYGGSQADKIITGDGNDIIYANGGGDLIDSGSGFDTVWLGSGEATVILDTGTGYDTIKNFQLGATTLQVENTNQLNFTNSADGVQVFDGDDLLAVVFWNRVDTFNNNFDAIFA